MASLLSSQAKKAISGRKGGEGHTPVETPNNLLSTSSAKMLLALGEGEWQGGVDGSNIYLDGTPLLDSQGNENFPGTKWEFRPGSVQQAYIQGIPSVENELAINTELTYTVPWVRSVTNSMLSAVRLRLRWPALQQQKDNGDIVGLTIVYRIEVATDGGGYQTLLQTSVTGKTNTTYERSHRIDLPSGSNWQVRVSRITPNQNKTIVADSMFIAAITEVVDAKFSYPNTALLYIEFDAEQFNSIPSVAVKAKMRKVRVPTNYDPVARTYSGTWDGSFKIAWTNNPAWISYDIILEDRFGTGQYIDASLVDKWELYQIAQYCDQSVPDGKGGSEPRFLCDIYIQQAKEAWQVLRDLAAIYRGMSYWANGQMYSVADMPRDMDFLYTNANVVDGKFSYTGTSVRSKFTRALVSYDDPDNDYNTDVTSVGDISLQQRFGDNPVELSAIGCTRESEAQRRGQWAIHTNNADRMVGFSVGLDGQVPLPGMIIGVADRLVAGKRFGGRIKAVNGLNITLDQACDAAANDSLIVNLPSGKAEKRTITEVNGAVITVSAAYSETPAEQLQWSVESNTLVPQLFRVMTIRKADSDEIEYQISAVEHNPSKFNAIDNGTKLLDRPISVLPAKTQASPATINISQRTYVEQTQSITVMIIDWPKTDGAVAYDVQWRKDDGDWVSLPRTGSNSVEVVGVYTGSYLARVRAINSVNVASIYTESVLTDLTGKDANLSLPTSLTATSIAFGINLYWGFPLGSEDTLHTEIQIASDNFGSDAQKLVDVAYPSASYVVGNLPKGTAYYFRARLVDKVGNKGAYTPWTYGASSSNQSDYDTLFGETFKSYTWFAWADDDAGTGFTTNEAAGKGKKWMGVATDKAVSAPSGNWEDYTWTQVQTDIPEPFTPAEEAALDNLMAGKLPAGDKDMLALQDALNDPQFNNNMLTAQQLLNQGIDAADLGGETPAGAQAKANAAEAAAALDALNKANIARDEAISIARSNLLDLSGWSFGASNNIGNLSRYNGETTSVNVVKYVDGPFGAKVPAWEFETTVDQYPDGSWGGGFKAYLSGANFDHKKAYRFSCWVKRSELSGFTYMGYNTVWNLGTTDANGNPYSIPSNDPPVADEWYLMVAVIHGSEYAGTELSGLTGYWDAQTGKRVFSGPEYRIMSGEDALMFRLSQYRTPLGAKMLCYAPLIQAIDGTETPISSILVDPAVSEARAVTAAYDAINETSSVSLVANGEVSVFGNSIKRNSTAIIDWTASAHSKEVYVGGAIVTASIASGTPDAIRFMIGLNRDPDANAGYNTLDYALYANNDYYSVYESGVGRGIVLSVAPAIGDVVSVAYDGVKVSYYVNGAVVRTVSAPANLALYLDSSFVNVVCGLKGVQFSPLSNMKDASDDANSKSLAAQQAAESYALAQSNLAETQAKAYADNKVSLEESRAIADAQAKANTARDEAVSSSSQALDARINAGEATGLDNLLSGSGLPFAKDLLLYGDINTYYPVVFFGGNQDKNRRIKIWRGYSERGPSDWNTATHKGQLNLDWLGNFGGWGGAGYFEQILNHTHQYSYLLADAYRFGANMMYVFFLRGGGSGGALYHFASDQDILPEVYYNQELIHSASNTYAPAPISAVNWERIHNLRIGYNTFGNLIGYSAQFESLKARLALFNGLTAETIAALAIATNHLQAGAVVTDKLAAGAVTSDKLTADTALINKLFASQGLFDELQARIAVFGGLAAESIAAKAITTQKLAITARNLVNNVSQTGTKDGWTGGNVVSHTHNGSQTSALEVSSSGDTQHYSHWFEVDNTKIYEVNFTIHRVSGGSVGSRYFGMHADGDGYVNYVNPDTRVVGSSTNNFYFWSGDISNGQYRQMRAYIIGSEVDAASIPESLNVSSCVKLSPGQSLVRLRALNFYNAGQTTVDRWLNMSVTELGGGQISANQLLANSALFNQLKAKIGSFGGLTANELQVDTALINKLVGTSALFNDLVARLAVFGGLTANSIAAGAILGTHIKAGEKIQSPIIEGGQLRLIGSGYMKVQAATPFGPDALVEWYGPKLLSGTEPNWGALKKSNAITYLAANGDAYFGGSLSAGVLKTGVTNPDKNLYAASSIPVLIGPFGTNGKPKNVVVSYDLSADSTTSSGSSISNKSLQWQLQRSIGNGTWTTVSSGTFTIAVTKMWNPEFGYYDVREYCHASSTYTDNSTSTSDFQYRLLVVSATRYHVVSQVSSQTLSIVSTEQ